jgi:hypothetical protein
MPTLCRPAWPGVRHIDLLFDRPRKEMTTAQFRAVVAAIAFAIFNGEYVAAELSELICAGLSLK